MVHLDQPVEPGEKVDMELIITKWAKVLGRLPIWPQVKKNTTLLHIAPFFTGEKKLGMIALV